MRRIAPLRARRLPSLGTTVDEVLLAGAVSAHDGVEEQEGDVRLLVGGGESLEWDEVLLLPVEELGVHVRAAVSDHPFENTSHSRLVGRDVTGAEGVDSDAVVGPLDGELLDDRRGGGLGRVVEDLVDALVDDLRRLRVSLRSIMGRRMTHHGRGEDDGALLVSGLDPQVGDGLGTGKLAPDVDVVDEREVLLLHLKRILDDRDTGVGDEAGDLAELVVDLLEGALDELGIADIALPGLDLDAVLLGDLRGDLGGVLGRVVDDGDVGAGLGERLGDGSTDTSVTARDDDGGLLGSGGLACGGIGRGLTEKSTEGSADARGWGRENGEGDSHEMGILCYREVYRRGIDTVAVFLGCWYGVKGRKENARERGIASYSPLGRRRRRRQTRS